MSTHKERQRLLEVAESKNIVDVAQDLGMELIRNGRNYIWAEHDSFVFNTRKNLFYWNSRQQGGGVIQLVKLIKECSYLEAVNYLNNIEAGTYDKTKQSKKAPFQYRFKEHSQMNVSIKYLMEERKLSKETIDFFIDKGLIAQITYKDYETGKTEPVIVFKHKDLEGKIRGVSLQGIWKNNELHGDRGRLKKTIGDGFYGMNIRVGNPPDISEATSENPIKIIAFESPIDLMSYYELFKETIGDAILLSMNGLRKGTISTFLVNELGMNVEESKKSTMLDEMEKMYQPIDKVQIVLSVDNDEFNPKLGMKPGQNFVETFGVSVVPVTSSIPELLPGKNKSDWNDHVQFQKSLLNSIVEDKEQVTRTRLDIAKQKLERLENEYTEKKDVAFNHLAQANGQPMNDKRGGAQFLSKQEQKDDAVFSKLHEIEEQQKRVDKLADQQELKDNGLNKQGGLIMSVDNIPRIKKEIELSKEGKSLYSRSTIRKYEKNVIELEQLKVQSEDALKNISDHAKFLIENGDVTVWNKNPTLYFVNGLRKVALELTHEGEFQVSPKYAPKTEQEIEKIFELLTPETSVVMSEFEETTIVSEEKIMENSKQEEDKAADNLKHYFVVGFNEHGGNSPDYTGQIVTEELISRIQELDQQMTHEPGYIKFYFDEIIDGEVVDHIRMDAGDGLVTNKTIYDQLMEVAIQNQMPLDVHKEESKEMSAKKTITVSNDYYKAFQDVLEDSFKRMEKEPEGTKHYLTVSQVQKMLDDHFTKVEQLLSHSETSSELLMNPTKEEATQLRNGTLEIVAATNEEIEKSLSEALSEAKQTGLTNVKEKVNQLRIAVKNAFNKRILAINNRLKKFVEKIDNKFALESLNPEEQVAVEKELSSPEEEKTTLISNVQKYIKLSEEKDNLLGKIKKTIQEDPLARIDNLQNELQLIQTNISELEQLIENETPSIDKEMEPTTKAAKIDEFAELVKDKDRLQNERDRIASQPNFLRSNDVSEGMLTPLESFKQVDRQLKEVEEKIEHIEKGKEKQVSKEQRTVADPFTLATAAAVQKTAEQVVKNNSLGSAISNKNEAEIKTQLKTNMKEYFDSKNIKSFLSSASKFHNYSPKNVQLIMEQDPKATQVASENKWNQLGYELKEDAKPIHVYQPKFVNVLDKNGNPIFKENNQTETKVAFQLKPVYDVSQTTKEKLDMPTSFDFSEKNQFSAVYQSISNLTNAKIVIQPLEGEACQYIEDSNTLVIAQGLGEEQTIRTLLDGVVPLYNAENEVTKYDRNIDMFEQEAAAYMLANHIGLDTSSYNFSTLDRLKESGFAIDDFSKSLNNISKNATELINTFDEKFKKVEKVKEKETTNKFDDRLTKAEAMNKATAEQLKTKEYTAEQTTSLRR